MMNRDFSSLLTWVYATSKNNKNGRMCDRLKEDEKEADLFIQEDFDLYFIRQEAV